MSFLVVYKDPEGMLASIVEGNGGKQEGEHFVDCRGSRGEENQ